MSNERLTEKQLSWIQDLIRRNNINPTEEEQNRIMNMDKPTASKVIDELKATGQLNLSKIEAETKKENATRNENIARGSCLKASIQLIINSDMKITLSNDEDRVDIMEFMFDLADEIYNRGKDRKGYW